MELIHKHHQKALGSNIKNEPGTVKIWRGYLAPTQEKFINTAHKSALYNIDFRSLDELVKFACSKKATEKDARVVTILPYKMLTANQHLRLHNREARVLYMNIDEDLQPEHFVQIEGIIATGIAYLNDNDLAFSNLYRILTNSSHPLYAALESLKKNPNLAISMIFELMPAKIKTGDLKHLNDRMNYLLSNA